MLWLLLPNALTDREARERWRRPATVGWLGAYATFLAVSGALLFQGSVPRDVEISGSGIGAGHALFQQYATLQYVVWAALGVYLGAPNLAIERQRRSLLDFFMAGLTPAQIVAAKWRSVATFALVVMLCPLPVLAVCFVLGGVPPAEYMAFVVLLLSIGLSSCALGLLVSVESRDVSAALSTATINVVCALFIGGVLAIVLPQIPPISSIFGALGAWLAISSCLDLTKYKLTQICMSLGDELQSSHRFEAKFSFDFTLDTAGNTSSIPIRCEVSREQYESGDFRPHTMVNGVLVPLAVSQSQIEMAGRHDVELSDWENQLDSLSFINPIARRMWRSHIGTTYRVEDELSFYPAWGAIPIGLFLGVWSLAYPTQMLYAVANVVVVGVLSGLLIAQIAPTFTSEREAGTLQPLILTALSSNEILAGKFLGATLIALRLGFWPLVALGMWGLGCGLMMWVTVQWLLLAHLSSTLSVAAWASLRCRQSSVAAGVAGVITLVLGGGGLLCFLTSNIVNSDRALIVWGFISTLAGGLAWMSALRALRRTLMHN